MTDAFDFVRHRGKKRPRGVNVQMGFTAGDPGKCRGQAMSSGRKEGEVYEGEKTRGVSHQGLS